MFKSIPFLFLFFFFLIVIFFRSSSLRCLIQLKKKSN